VLQRRGAGLHRGLSRGSAEGAFQALCLCLYSWKAGHRHAFPDYTSVVTSMKPRVTLQRVFTSHDAAAATLGQAR